MGAPRLDDDEFRRWFTTAGEHLDAARITAEGGSHNWACVTAEQAAQAAVKALLHAVGTGDRARGHDLLGLAGTCDEALGGSLSTDHADALKRLYPPLPAGTVPGRSAWRCDTASDLHPGPTPTRPSATPRRSSTPQAKPTTRSPRRCGVTTRGTTRGRAAMRVDVAKVRALRQRQRQQRLDLARDVADDLAERMPLVAAIVVGSTARGDLADTSDVDVLVIAEALPDDFRRRAELVDPGVAGVEVIAWTVEEWRHRRRVGNPLVRGRRGWGGAARRAARRVSAVPRRCVRSQVR